MDTESDIDSCPYETFESPVTSNDLLLENILRHLPFKGLLNSSLINQRWLRLSRKELRRRKCLAFVHCNGGGRPCRKLIELSNLLEERPVESLPFNGLRMDYSYHQSCVHYFSLAPDGDFLRVMSKCRIKYFRLFLNEYTDCPTMKFIKLLFITRGSEIEELSISNYSEFFLDQGLTNFLGIPVTSNWLPNLRTLEMDSEMTEEVLIQIVSGAPNLREIRGFIGLRHTRFLVEAEKVDLVTEFRLDPDPAESLDACLEFARRRPKLKFLFVTSRLRNDPWESQQFLEILALLMEGSAATLQKLEITHIDLLLLSTLDFSPMQKLKEISQNYCPKLDRHLGRLSLQWIDYPKLFPVLESVNIQSEVWQYGSHSFETVPENLQRVLNKLSSRRVHSGRSVRSLVFSGKSISQAWSDPLVGLTDLFPALTSITFGKYPDLKPYLDLILGSKWPLENIALECTQQGHSKKKLRLVNALLCGVSPEESIHLAALDWDSLQKFNFVPFEHSLINFTNLKSLEIVVRHAGRSNSNGSSAPSLISNVARALMSSKIPWLNIYEIADP